MKRVVLTALAAATAQYLGTIAIAANPTGGRRNRIYDNRYGVDMFQYSTEFRNLSCYARAVVPRLDGGAKLSLASLTSRQAVLDAIAEYDALGRDAFLDQYGYGRSFTYFVMHNGKEYDSKAIAGVAVGKQHPERGPMENSEFGGGAEVRRALEPLGFKLEESSATPSATITNSAHRAAVDRPAWFVGSMWSESGGDQTQRFLTDGVWENGYTEGPTLDEVRTIQPGDRIAIKASFTRKNDLPFPFKLGQSASVMRIKAAGVVTENLGDGKKLKVEWTPHYATRDWYFYTARDTIWRVAPIGELQSRLLAFAFDGKPQDYGWFLSRPHWIDKSSSDPPPLPEVTSASVYTIDEALDGLFLERVEFENIIGIWRSKKNIVLQGAPGVGKSFVARRLAYALVGGRDDLRIDNIQFHQSYSYEDFVQGYKPKPSGGFELRDGVFHRFCRRAVADQDQDYVFIIDEINRGNLSKIFGELMLLIESDKRSSEWGAQLAYAHGSDPKFFVPPNVFVIGMMNTADRSLSMVDYALRRRFVFHMLEPAFSSPKFTEFLVAKAVPQGHVDRIILRMGALNQAIAEDTLNLGHGYKIGHSFFVPTSDVLDADGWYRRVIECEIAPLLEEYWFDAPEKARSWRNQLLAGM